MAVCFAVLAGLFYMDHLNDHRLLARTAASVVGSDSLTDEQLLVRFSSWAEREIRNPSYAEINPPLARLYYKINPFHPGPGDVLRWGSDYRGSCGSHTRVVVAMLQARGVKCRPLFLINEQGKAVHTVVQAEIDGRWVVSDAMIGVTYRRRDGKLAEAKDLAADTSFFWPQTHTRVYYNPMFTYDRVAIMNWKKVPVILPAIKNVAQWIVGREAIESFPRPSIWMWPRAMMTLICGTIAVLFALAALWRGRAG